MMTRGLAERHAQQGLLADTFYYVARPSTSSPDSSGRDGVRSNKFELLQHQHAGGLGLTGCMGPEAPSLPGVPRTSSQASRLWQLASRREYSKCPQLKILEH